MAITIQRSGFTHTPELTYAIINDLVSNGFTMNFPTGTLPSPVGGTAYAGFKATLEAGTTVDPLAATQPWRIHFDCISDKQYLSVNAATPLQLPNDGSAGLLDNLDGSTVTGQIPSGMLNTKGVVPVSTEASDNSAYYFIFRSYTGHITSDLVAASYPMSYRLSVSDHGIMLAVWEDATDAALAPKQSWMVVQRPVDNITGAPLVVGHCPVVCVFSMASSPMKFIVREADVLKPTKPIEADIDTPDSNAILNSIQQVSITEANRYVITFPNGLNTPRYMYTEELDLMAYTSADVISAYSDVPITVYGEAAARSYKALPASGVNNTGMRVLMVTKGAGIP